jgi:hypothetical protein
MRSSDLAAMGGVSILVSGCVPGQNSEARNRKRSPRPSRWRRWCRCREGRHGGDFDGFGPTIRSNRSNLGGEWRTWTLGAF